jgi:hypothetical protein
MSSEGKTEKATWKGLIGESVHTSDDKDIGDIEAVSRDFVVVKRGRRHVHRYYIPTNRVEGWDGDTLWLFATEDEVKENYERKAIPDHTRYYITDVGDNAMYYGSGRLPELRIFQTRYAKPTYPAVAASTGVYRCDLCESTYPTGEELSSHVLASHGEVSVKASAASTLTSPVLDWDSVIHKNVRASDMVSVGNVGAVTGDTIVIIKGPTREFIVPKSHVSEFDGAEVHLDLPFQDLQASYRTMSDR